MATSRRIERVASMVKREVSLMLLNGIKDDRVGAGMVSVTDVICFGRPSAYKNFCQHLRY